MIAATERRLTPTFPYLKKGTRTQKNRTSAQLASTNLMESKGNTRRQNTKSATQRLIIKAAATLRTLGYLHNAMIVNKLPVRPVIIINIAITAANVLSGLENLDISTSIIVLSVLFSRRNNAKLSIFTLFQVKDLFDFDHVRGRINSFYELSVMAND